MSLQVWLPLTKNTRQQGLSNIAVTNNGATFNSAGKLGGCYYFNGNQQWLQFDTVLGDYYNNDWTVACWLKPTDSTRSVIISEFSGTGASNVAIELTTARVVRLYWAGSPDVNFSTAGALPLNEWTHIAMTKTGRVVKLYFNGELKQTYTNSSDYIDNNYLYEIVIKTVLSIIVGIAVIIINRCIINNASHLGNDKKMIIKTTLLMCLIIYVPAFIACFSALSSSSSIWTALYACAVLQGFDMLFYFFALFCNKEIHNNGSQTFIMFILFFFSGCYLYPIMYILLMISLNDVLNYYHGDIKEKEIIIENPNIDEDHIDEVKEHLKQYTKTCMMAYIVICIFIGFVLVFGRRVYVNDNEFANYLFLMIPFIIIILVYIILRVKNYMIIDRLKNEQIKKTLSIEDFSTHNCEVMGSSYVVIIARVGKKVYKSYPYFGDLDDISVRLLIYDDKRRKYILDVYKKNVIN